MEYLIGRVKEAISHLFTDSDLILVELKALKEKQQIKFRFLVDRPRGGITLGECAQLNQQIGQILDNEQFLGESYALEVFSPGLGRPLSSCEDFTRVIGKDVRVFLKEPVKDKIELSGRVNNVEDKDVVFLINSEPIKIPIDKIIKGKQVI